MKLLIGLLLLAAIGGVLYAAINQDVYVLGVSAAFGFLGALFQLALSN